MRNGRLNLNQILSRKLIVLLAAQIVSVVCFGSFGVWTARERQKEAVEYILKMYQQSLDTVLSTLENDLEDILSRQQLLELLQHRSELQRWHACYSLAEVLRDKRISSRDVDGYIIADSAHRNFLMNRSENITYGELKALEDYMLQEAESGKTNSGWISARLAGESYLLRYYNIYFCLRLMSFWSEIIIPTACRRRYLKRRRWMAQRRCRYLERSLFRCPSLLWQQSRFLPDCPTGTTGPMPCISYRIPSILVYRIC